MRLRSGRDLHSPRTPAAHIFAWCVIFNLAPRAVSHHAWYREKFGDAYPSSTKTGSCSEPAVRVLSHR